MSCLQVCNATLWWEETPRCTITKSQEKLEVVLTFCCCGIKVRVDQSMYCWYSDNSSSKYCNLNDSFIFLPKACSNIHVYLKFVIY